MATTIITKNGSGAPLEGDLTAGELAVDLTNKRLYSKDSGGNVIELGTNAGSSTFADLTVLGDLTVDTNTLYVDSTNNRVGINDAAPDRAFVATSSQQVVGRIESTSTAGFLAFSDSGSANEINVRLGSAGDDFKIYTGGAEQVTIASSGNVGIGTSSPDTLLHVGTTNVSGNVKLAKFSSSNANANAQIDFTNSANTAVWSTIGSPQANHFSIETNGSERMRIDSSGKLLVGTTSSGLSTSAVFEGPSAYSAALVAQSDSSVNNWARIDLVNQNAAHNGIVYLDQSGNFVIRNDAASASTTAFIAGNSADGTFKWESKVGTERMRLDSSGNLQVTGTLGNATLEGNGAVLEFSRDGANYIGARGGSSSFLIFQTGGATEKMRLDASGNLLVGATAVNTVSTTSFGAQLSGNGEFRSYRNAGGNGAAARIGGNAGEALIYGDGDIKNTNNSYGALSDERLKSNIVDSSSQLDDIMAVQVRSYTLNETGDTHMGVVAQELEAAGMSGLVDEDEEGMKSVKYSILYLKAIKALQEAVTRIETLEAEVAALKGA